MTNEWMDVLIDNLNNNNLEGRIFRSKLTENIEIANIWESDPDGVYQNSMLFFLIKNEHSKYIAVVQDRGSSDLHLFVKKEFRKQGYLKRAMHEVIFPYLYQNGREKQSVTFKEINVAEYLEKNLNFVINKKENTGERDLSDFANFIKISKQGYWVTRSNIEEMKEKITKASQYLEMVNQELSNSCGEYDNTRITKIIYDINNLKDFIWQTVERNQDITDQI